MCRFSKVRDATPWVRSGGDETRLQGTTTASYSHSKHSCSSWNNLDVFICVISSPVFRVLQHSSVRTCALATLCSTTLSARVGEVCSIKSVVYTEKTSGCYNLPLLFQRTFIKEFESIDLLSFIYRRSDSQRSRSAKAEIYKDIYISLHLLTFGMNCFGCVWPANIIVAAREFDL